MNKEPERELYDEVTAMVRSAAVVLFAPYQDLLEKCLIQRTHYEIALALKHGAEVEDIPTIAGDAMTAFCNEVGESIYSAAKTVEVDKLTEDKQ